MVEITDRKSAYAWAEKEDYQTQVWLATRCALRGLPGLGTWREATESGLALVILRATLVSAAMFKCSVPEMTQLIEVSASSTHAALSSVNSSISYVARSNIREHAAYHAAISAVYCSAKVDLVFGSYYTAADSVARSVTCSAGSSGESASRDHTSVTYISAKSLAWSAASWDSEAPLERTKLWGNFGQPDGLRQAWDALKEQWAEDAADWSFWVEWYERILRGDPMDWRLIFRIATEVTEEEWEAGQERVAARIRGIREQYERDGDKDRREQAFEPKSVSNLFENRVVAAASAASLSTVVAQQFSVFVSETGLNDIPDLFKPLEGLPPVLDRIAGILETQPRNTETEQKLREEVGRLLARIAALETQLAKAKDNISELEKNTWKKVAAWTVGSANLFGVLLAAVWTVSGDELGPTKRLDRLSEYRDFIFGADDASAPADHQVLPRKKNDEGWGPSIKI